MNLQKYRSAEFTFLRMTWMHAASQRKILLELLVEMTVSEVSAPDDDVLNIHAFIHSSDHFTIWIETVFPNLAHFLMKKIILWLTVLQIAMLLCFICQMQ